MAAALAERRANLRVQLLLHRALGVFKLSDVPFGELMLFQTKNKNANWACCNDFLRELFRLDFLFAPFYINVWIRSQFCLISSKKSN